MENIELNIRAYEQQHRQDVLSVWERSTRATHHFVSLEDLQYYKQLVCELDFLSFPTYTLSLGGSTIGILGVNGNQIEMLFIDPDYMGKGFGKYLLSFAITVLKADEVSVNEQNRKAVDFYSRLGFAPYARTEKDAHGMSYPMLQMKLGERMDISVPIINIRLLEKGDSVPYDLLLDADPSRILVDKYLSKGITHIAMQAGEVLGVCVLNRINKETVEIKNLAVKEQQQGKGIGKALITHAFGIAKQLDCKTIHIATSTPNIGPLYLYQKMGFEYDYIVKHYFDNNAENYESELYDNGIKCNHLIVLSKRL